MKKFKLVFLVIFLVSSNVCNAYSHSGRTDSNGGHYNRSTGVYHYHGGSSNPSTSVTTSSSSSKTSKVVQPPNSISAKIYNSPVIINGKDINVSSTVEYPVFEYKDIIYLPLSNVILKHLGITSVFHNNELQLNTTKYEKTNFTIKTDYSTNDINTYLIKSDYKITINGEIIDNNKELYPFVSYKNVMYIPLTWNNVANKLFLNFENVDGKLIINNKFESVQKNLDDLLIEYSLNNDMENLKIVIEKGANPNIYFENEGNSIPIIAAVTNTEVAKILLDNGALLNNKAIIYLNGEKYEILPIECKIISKELDIIKLYLQYNYDKNTIVYSGESLLQFLNNSYDKDNKEFYDSIITLLK